MHPKGPESSSRQLVWIEGPSVAAWSCSECGWTFDLSDQSSLPAGKTLDEITRNLRTQLSEEFAAHDCARHPRVKAASSS